MKKLYKIEKCYKCDTSKAILKQTMFYGKATWICKECHNLKKSFELKPSIESYWAPSKLVWRESTDQLNRQNGTRNKETSLVFFKQFTRNKRNF